MTTESKSFSRKCNDDTDDDTDDDNDHKRDSYTAGGAAPTQTRPDRALDRCSEALDRSIMKIFSSSIDLDGSQGRFIALTGGL